MRVSKADKKQNHNVRSSMKEATTLFAEYDRNADGVLDFEEFYAMLPHRVRDGHTAEDIHAWFNGADTDGNGTLSINEFFCWTLSNAAEAYGASSIEAALRKFDKSPDKSGRFDLLAFERICGELGFGEHHAQSVFRSLDKDGTGWVDTDEIAASLRLRPEKARQETKQLVTTLMWANGDSEAAKAEQKRALERQASTWRIRGNDAATVRKELQERLANSGALVSDLLNLFDDDATGEQQIDDMEFHKTMKNRFGWKGFPWVLDEVFKSIDTDRSGHIGFDELFEFVRGRRHALDRRTQVSRKMQLQPGPDYQLDELVWDAEELKNQIFRMCEICNVSTADLLRAFDKGGDKTLSKLEFMGSMRELFTNVDHEKLWDEEVKPVAAEVFETVSGTSKGVDMSELEAWLTDAALPDHGTGAKGSRRQEQPPAKARRPPLLKSQSKMMAQNDLEAKAKARDEARRQAARARAIAEAKASAAIANAANVASARKTADRAAQSAAREAIAERRAFMLRTPYPDPMPATSLLASVSSASLLLPASRASTPAMVSSRGMANAKKYAKGKDMMRSSSSSSLLPSVNGRRRPGTPVLTRWEVDSSLLPSGLKPASLTFCIKVPRTRREGWQGQRASVVTLPPHGQLRPSSAIPVEMAMRRLEQGLHRKLTEEMRPSTSWKLRR